MRFRLRIGDQPAEPCMVMFGQQLPKPSILIGLVALERPGRIGVHGSSTYNSTAAAAQYAQGTGRAHFPSTPAMSLRGRWSEALDGVTVRLRQAPSSTERSLRTAPYELQRNIAPVDVPTSHRVRQPGRSFRMQDHDARRAEA